jgi:dephospho-CoA kinase
MIIGITGSFGAGKGVVVDYLVNTKGFKHFSARQLITEEIERRGLPVNRDSMIVVSNDLRAIHGPDYIIKTLYERAVAMGGDAVIESIREMAGVRFLHEQGGFVLGVDAEPSVRYNRAFNRGSETDNVSFEKWLAQEQAESNPDDPTKQDIFGTLRASDAIVNNNGTLEELYTQIEEALEKLR